MYVKQSEVQPTATFFFDQTGTCGIKGLAIIKVDFSTFISNLANICKPKKLNSTVGAQNQSSGENSSHIGSEIKSPFIICTSYLENIYD